MRVLAAAVMVVVVARLPARARDWDWDWEGIRDGAVARSGCLNALVQGRGPETEAKATRHPRGKGRAMTVGSSCE